MVIAFYAIKKGKIAIANGITKHKSCDPAGITPKGNVMISIISRVFSVMSTPLYISTYSSMFVHPYKFSADVRGDVGCKFFRFASFEILFSTLRIDSRYSDSLS